MKGQKNEILTRRKRFNYFLTLSFHNTTKFFPIATKQYFLSILIIGFSFFFNNTFAQEYLDIESNNIRIEPEWTVTYEAGDFIWSYDIKIDNNGNTYSTGYFQRNLKTKEKYIEPTTKCASRCPDTYFLMKHDNKGNLIWIRYANGNSRPSKVVIDHKGFIYTIGSVYSTELIFTSSDSEIVKLEKPNDYNSGIFICKYDSTGKVIKTKFLSDGKSEFVNDILIDDEENIYLGGGYQFRSYNNRSEVKNSFLLMKLNYSFELIWKQVGDTIGRSVINSIFIDSKTNVVATGGFENNIKFGKTEFSTSRSDGNAFVAKFNNNGKLDWAIDSLGKFRMGSGQEIVCDKNGNAYVTVNTSYSFLFFSKIDKSGKLQWINTIKGKSSNTNQKMLLDNKSNIYLCGEGYGAVFGSNSSELFSYKSKGGTDFYLAKYNSKGECLWLKVGGGKGTDYCKAIALYNNNLYAFGWFGNEMSFNEKILKSKSGYTFWLANFDLKKLEKVDKSPQKPIAKTDNLQEKFRVNKINCECYQYAEKQTRFTPSLETLIPYESFNKMTGWKYSGKENFYESVFFKNLQTSSNTGNAFYSLTTIAYKPIRIMHPDNTFAINITPCANENKIYELPITINYEHSINKYISDFDYELFDRTTKSYLEVLLNIVGVREEEILNKVLFNYEMTEIQPFISTVNSKYHTELKLDSLNEEESIANILSELKSKNVDFSDFLLKEFILTDNSNHIINDDEQYRMLNIFSEWLGNITMESIDKIIYPQISATIATKSINIEINENIIRRWNPLRNEPMKEKNGNFISTNILTETSSLNYSTSDGLDVFIKDVCLNSTEIAGTGILLNFNKAQIIGSLKKHYNLLEYYNYPLFVTDSISEHIGDFGIDNFMRYVYDTLLTNFSGLFIQVATLNIPIKNKVISAQGSNLIINNKLISGTIIFKTEGLSDSKNIPSKIKFVINESSTIEITIEELRQYFRNIGIKDFKFIKEGGQLKMFFKTILQ
jgi:hypothetical protein